MGNESAREAARNVYDSLPASILPGRRRCIRVVSGERESGKSFSKVIRGKEALRTYSEFPVPGNLAWLQDNSIKIEQTSRVLICDLVGCLNEIWCYLYGTAGTNHSLE